MKTEHEVLSPGEFEITGLFYAHFTEYRGKMDDCYLSKNEVKKCFAFFEKNTEQIEKKLTKLLFDCCGINSLVVHGNSTQPQNSDLPDTGHAWNIVSFEKASYHLDITFDITVMTHSVERYDYFNLCDSEIAIDHMWDRHAVMSLLSQVHMVQ